MTDLSTRDTTAMRLLKQTVPWIVLAVLLIRTFAIVADYRSAQQRLQKAGTETTATVNPKQESDQKATSESTAKPSSTKASTVVVLIDGLNFRTAPSSTAKVVTTLKADDRLTLLSTREGWYRVRTKSGRVGWVTANERWTRIDKE